MIATIIVATYFFGVSADAKSNKPTPSRGEANRQSQTKSNNDKANPDTNKQGTESEPFVVKVIGAKPQTQNSPATNSKELQEKSPDWWMVGATAALVGVGLLQLAAFTVQACRLGQTFNLIKDTSERQLRAYIGFKYGHARLDERSVIGANVCIRNSGQTPAYDLVITASSPVTDRHNGPPWLNQSQAITPIIYSKTILDPEGEPVPITTDELGFIQNSVNAMFFWGRAEYKMLSATHVISCSDAWPLGLDVMATATTSRWLRSNLK